MLTRDNFDEMLDAGSVWMEYDHGRDVPLRRGGQTKRWARSPRQLCTRVLFGADGALGGTTITEACFWPDGTARSFLFLYPRR